MQKGETLFAKMQKLKYFVNIREFKKCKISFTKII